MVCFRRHHNLCHSSSVICALETKASPGAEEYVARVRLVMQEKASDCNTINVFGASDGPWVYELVESSKLDLCGPSQYGALPTRLRYYLDGKQFCAWTKVIDARSNFAVNAVSTAWNKVSPGPKRRYGFMNEWQRLSFAYRYDGGHGVSTVVPLGLELPGFGGWLLLKTNAVFSALNSSFPPPVERGSVEAFYTPSASRIVDWYVGVGGESESACANTCHWRSVGELGLKFRFSLEKIRLIRFFGGRVAVRTNDFTPFSHTRLVRRVRRRIMVRR